MSGVIVNDLLLPSVTLVVPGLIVPLLPCVTVILCLTTWVSVSLYGSSIVPVPPTKVVLSFNVTCGLTPFVTVLAVFI